MKKKTEKNSPFEVGYTLLNFVDTVRSRVATRNEFKKTLAFLSDTATTLADALRKVDSNGKPVELVGTIQDITERKQLEKALLESEEGYRGLVETSSDWIWETNAKGVYTYASPQVETILGYKSEEVVGKTPFDLMEPAEAERVAIIFGDLVRAGKPITALENTNLHKDGRPIILETSGVPVFDDEGQVTRYRGVDRDITESRRVAAGLRESEFFLRETQKVARLGGWKLNPETDFLAWTEGVYDIIEAPADYKPGLKDGLKYYVPKYLPALQELIHRCYTHGDSFAMECELVTDSGRRLWTEVRGVARVVEGKTAYVYGTFQDIDERKKSEEELHHLRSYLSSIIDSMPSVLVGVDKDANIIQWNTEAKRSTGVSAETAMGQPLDKVIPHLAKEMKRVRESMQTDEVRSNPRQARNENGRTLYENVTIYPLVANGAEGAVIRVDDVTERVQMEEMVVQSEKMLSVGGLAAGMAHEINNPLGGMMQNAEVLTRRLTQIDLPANIKAAKAAGITMEAIQTFMEDRKVPEMLGSIRESGNRAAKIVTNMLSFARKSESSPSSHNLAELLDRCVELAGTDYNLKRKYDFRQIEIVREYNDDLPLVPCESGKIQQVLLNILRNGAEAMLGESDHGGRKAPRFVLRLEHESETDMIRIEIEDNGPGMDEKTRKRIFEPFFTTKPTSRGTGLGLSVSYFIITENHSGKINVESTPGKGTKFILLLHVVPRTPSGHESQVFE